MRERRLVPRVALVLGLAFLYGPILSMIVFSFNNSRLVTVWDAAHSPTLKWYGALLHNEQILGAAWLSIRIAVIAASVAVVLGTLAGTALAPRRLPRPAAARRHGHRAHRHARGHHGAIAPPHVRRPRAADRLAEGRGCPHHHARPHHLLHGLRHRGGAVAARRLRRVARGGGDGSRRAPRAGVFPHHAAPHPAGHCLRLAARVYTVVG